MVIHWNRLVKAVLTSTNNLCFEQKYEKKSDFFSKHFQFLVVKFLIYLKGRVLVVRFLIVLGFNDTSTLVGHFVSSTREREKR